MTRRREQRGSGFDPVAVREAIKGPGIDTRAWGQMARVDDDPDAIVWDAELGWLCDVTMIGGPLDGDGPVLCRVVSDAQGEGVGSYRPQRPSGLVVVQIPTADPNDVAIIVGQLHNEDETAPALAPAEINDDTIVEREAAEGQVAAIDTHMDILPDEDLDQQWRNVRITVQADTGQLLLAAPDADQPFIRGTDYADSADDLATAIGDFCQALITSVPTGPFLTLTVADAISAATPLLAATETFKATRDAYLSRRIKGD